METEKHRPPASSRKRRRVRSVRAASGASFLVGVVRDQAAAAGYLGGDKTERIGGRVTEELLSAARQKSRLHSDTELIEYALSKVALEDDYGSRLLARKGTIAADIEL